MYPWEDSCLSLQVAKEVYNTFLGTDVSLRRQLSVPAGGKGMYNTFLMGTDVSLRRKLSVPAGGKGGVQHLLGTDVSLRRQLSVPAGGKGMYNTFSGTDVSLR